MTLGKGDIMLYFRAMRKKIFIFLASQSERRRHLLRKMGIAFKVVPSRYREIHSERGNPKTIVMRHALGKARGAKLPKPIRPAPGEFILGSDTLVFFRGRLIGKPRSLKHAEKILVEMSGKSHSVYTGIALINCATGRVKIACEKTKVRFKKWTAEQIRACLARINPLDKASAYAIQDRPSMVASIRGSRSNVVGLPTKLLRKLLKNF